MLTRPASKRKTRRSKFKVLLTRPLRLQTDTCPYKRALRRYSCWWARQTCERRSPPCDACLVWAEHLFAVGVDRLLPVAGFSRSVRFWWLTACWEGSWWAPHESDRRWSALNSRFSWWGKQVNRCSSDYWSRFVVLRPCGCRLWVTGLQAGRVPTRSQPLCLSYSVPKGNHCLVSDPVPNKYGRTFKPFRFNFILCSTTRF